MTTPLEKARDWLQRCLKVPVFGTISIAVAEARALLAATEPVPPGELAEAMARLEQWLADCCQCPDCHARPMPTAIRTLIRAVRQQGEQPIAERVHVPQTEPPTWIGGMPDCPPPEDEQPEADPELVASYRPWPNGPLEAHRLALLQSDDVRNLAAISQVLAEREKEDEADDLGGEVVVPLEPILETTLECRVKQVPDPDSTSGYRVQTSLVAQQPKADPELVAHYRCFGTTALHDLQADKEASQAETGRHIAAIGKVLQERGEQDGQAG